jgi:hypothetical protein
VALRCRFPVLAFALFSPRLLRLLRSRPAGRLVLVSSARCALRRRVVLWCLCQSRLFRLRVFSLLRRRCLRRFASSCAACAALSFSLGVFVGSSVVAFAGSRSLPMGFAPLVASVAARVVASGSSVAVGCCVGVDAVVLSSVPASSVQCFAAFASSGAGSCSLSSVAPVRALPKRGGSVSWLAGGVLSAPLPVRLAARTRAVVAAASVCAVVFFASPASRGSLLAAGAAVRRGLPVFAFACGFPASLLPVLGVGSWVAVSVGVFSGGFSWESHQSALF